MDREILCRPFPPDQVRTRPGRNGVVLSYVETTSIIARLNLGCTSWNFEIVEHCVQENEVFVIGKLTVDDGTVKMAFGGSSITTDAHGRVVSIADDFKSAASDALKKAATLLGIGAELHGASPPPAAAPRPPVHANGNGNGGAHAGGNRYGTSDRITARQLAAVQGAVRRLGVSRDELVGIVAERFQVGRLEDLSKRQASDLIDYFTSSGQPAASRA